MAIYTQLPIYKASYSLLLEISRLQKDIPKDSRYSIGQSLRSKIMDIIVLVYRASRSQNKVAIIMTMRETLLEVQVYIRLLCDMRQISEQRYGALATQTASMSKQMAAWEKSERGRSGRERNNDGQQAYDR